MAGYLLAQWLVAQHRHLSLGEAAKRTQRRAEHGQIVIGGSRAQDGVAVRADDDISDSIVRKLELAAGTLAWSTPGTARNRSMIPVTSRSFDT